MGVGDKNPVGKATKPSLMAEYKASGSGAVDTKLRY